jgi:polyhydroxyalkanoate synthesis regulator phasin
MSTVWRKYLDAVSEVSGMTRERAEALVRQVVGESGDGRANVQGLVDDLMKRQSRNRETIVSLVRTETSRAIRAMGLATSAEVERLQAQVADLKREVARMRDEARPAASTSTTGPTAKPATKRATKSATTPAAKRTTAASRTKGKPATGAAETGAGGGRPAKRPTRPAAKDGS